MREKKLIDKIKTKIDRRYKEYRVKSDTYSAGVADGLDIAEQIVESVQAEQNCIWYNNGNCDKRLPGTKCEIVSCVAYTAK